MLESPENLSSVPASLSSSGKWGYYLPPGVFWVGSMRWHGLNIGLAKIHLDFYVRLYGKTQTNFLANPIPCQSFPGDSVVKNPLASTGDTRNTGSIPVLGRSPGRGNGNLLQYSCLENPMDRGDWQSTVHGVAKSQTPPSDWVPIPCQVPVTKSLLQRWSLWL